MPITKKLIDTDTIFTMSAVSHAYNKAKTANRRKKNALKHDEDRKHGKQDRYERSVWKECRWIDSSPSAYKSRKANESFMDELHDEWDITKSQANLQAEDLEESRFYAERAVRETEKKMESIKKQIFNLMDDLKFWNDRLEFLKNNLEELRNPLDNEDGWIF